MSDDSSTPLLSDTQRRIAGFALTMLAFVGSTALIIAVFAGLGQLLGFFSSVVWPLAVAGVLALILRPIVDWMESRLRMNRPLAVAVLYIITLLLLAGVLILVLPPLIDQIIGLAAYLPDLWDKIVTIAEDKYPAVHRQFEKWGVSNVTEIVGKEAKSLLTQALPTMKAAFGGLLDTFAFITHVVVIPVYLFFFLLMRGEPADRLDGHLPFLKPGVRDDVVFLANEFVSIVVSFFRGQLIIGLIMGILYAIGFSLIGLKFGMFIGLALGLLNIIPYLGTILGLATTMPLAFFQDGGGWHLVGWVIVVKLVVQAAESWVLTPKIMGDRTGLHPVAIIFAVFFWGTAFHGILGMLLAVPLTAFFVTAWRLAKRKYFRPIDA